MARRWRPPTGRPRRSASLRKRLPSSALITAAGSSFSSVPSVTRVALPMVWLRTSESGPNGETKPRVATSSGPQARRTWSARAASRSFSDLATEGEKRNRERLRKNMGRGIRGEGGMSEENVGSLVEIEIWRSWASLLVPRPRFSAQPRVSIRPRRLTARAERSKIEQCLVGEVRRRNMRQRAEHGFAAAGLFAFPRVQHPPHLLALQVFLRAAQVAGDDRECALFGVLGDFGFAAIAERTDQHVLAIVGQKLRRHRLQHAAMKQVQEERREDVVAMMPQRDLVEALAFRERVQRAAPQPRAQAAHRLAFRHHARDDAVGVLLDHVERHAGCAAVIRYHVFRKTRLLLVEVH